MLLAAVTGVCRTIPLAAGYRLADLASALHHAASPTRRSAVEANLQTLLGRPAPGCARDVFRHYGRFLFEWLRGPSGIPCAFEGWERLEAARARGRGVVLLVPHTGNFEVAGAAAAARGGLRVHALAGVQLNERWTPELRRRQEAVGVPILDWSFGSWRRLPRLLAANEVVALLADGDRFRGGLAVDAFGGRARFPAGPAKLCARTGAALLPAYALRRPDGTHVARFLDEIPVGALGAPRATARAAEVLAAVVRAHPEQWMIFRRFHEADGAPHRPDRGVAAGGACEVAA